MPGKSWPASTSLAATRPIHVGKGIIITDYDRILDLVKKHSTIKLDEIARVLSLKEELVAQELQTLEDNGLVDVKYPAFGEPLIYYKEPEA
jgi:predicted transcriptional regulator